MLVVIWIALVALLMAAWMAIANLNGWGQFTGWGMAHGGFIVALPVCAGASLAIVFLVSWLRRRGKAS